ncbi:PASTA domain-containing protein [Sediminibacterium roseum]|uniref:PASTA domain-containing protein n=1 Tax=Sediminibacterium roseum TaxID=1978412 RepID=A0ABW9ZS11_9BACT|nr:PASTA domain-containing protein [Sediminibacterium roseum]NCI49749.1 PASTA domain-containing protein [Sediminibacterium roseum]
MSLVSKYVTSKPLWVNILYGIGLVIVLVILFFFSLSWITGNGNEVKVPAVTGQNADAARKILEDKGFDVIIQDSVYVDSAAKLAVIRQLPEADATVKSGRTIYLTINRSIPPQVEMPNFAGFSVKSAELYLQSIGLKMGSITYEPDIARNAVLKQLYNGEIIAPGTKIPIGSVISFVLGSGEGGGVINVPDLVGMTLSEARTYLSTMGIDVGTITGTEEIKDSANAFVVRQIPQTLSDSIGTSGLRVPNKIKQGQIIDVIIGNTAPPREQRN